MSSPKPPAAPDPVATAKAQSGMNRETAITQYQLGATDQKTPFGNLTYHQTGVWQDGTPRFETHQSLSPDLQGTYDNLIGSANRLSGNLQNSVGTQFDTSGLPDRAASIRGGQGLQSNVRQDRVSLNEVPTNLSWSGPQARYNIDNAGPIQRDVGANDWSQDRQRVEEALFSRLDPQFQQDRSRQEADLVARGVRPGTAAYDRAMDTLNRSQTDARYQAVLAGGQEQSRLAGLELSQGNFRNAAQQQQYGQNANDAQFFNNAQNQNWNQSLAADQFQREGMLANNDTRLSQAGFNNNAALSQASFRNQTQNQGFNQDLAAGQFNNANRSQALQEQAFLRSLPMNEINALLSGTQIAAPQFQNTPQPGVAGVDYAGLVQQNYANQMQGYQQQVANRNGMLGGLASIGSSLFRLSDYRSKVDITRIGQTDGGLPIYTYRYANSDQVEVGVMAQDVAKVRPDAVAVMPDGYIGVDYSKIGEAA